MSTTETDAMFEPVRHSRLKLFDECPAVYAHGYDNDSVSLRKGSATHSMLLGDTTRVRIYEGRRDPRAKAYQDFLEQNPDCEILIPSEAKDVTGMRRSIERNPHAMQLLDGIREQRITWQYQGRECAGTPDVVHVDQKTGHKMVVELKTARTSKPRKFKWQAHSLRYHSQLAYYSYGLERTMLYKPGSVTAHKIVVVASSAPYVVTVLNVCQSKIKSGHQLWKQWFQTLLACEQSGQFGGYVDGEEDWEEEEEGDGLDWGSDEEAA